MRKLTLSAEDEVVKEARRLAAESHTSISAMFARLIRGMARQKRRARGVPKGSIAARATGFIALPKGKTARDVLADALTEKYGIRR